jgi:hypothetical protein
MSTLQTSNTNALIVDGFDASQKDPTASPIRGVSIRFKDGDYLAFGEKIDVRDRAFVVLDRHEGWQKLAKDCPPEYLMRKTGEPRPPKPYVAETDWPINLNGVPEHPFKLTHYLNLLDVKTGEVSTFWTNTIGGRIAIDQLNEQVTLMRGMKPGALPVVELRSADMPTQFGGTKPRPDFRILGYKERANVATPNMIAGPAAPVLQDVKSPSIAEELNDDLPDFAK